jgi:hypothetical protein
MSTFTYNFHQLVGVQIESDDPGLIRFFEAEYRPSAAPISQELSQVHLTWERSNWPFIKDYHFQSHKLLARWAYRISFQENWIEIHALGNQLAIPMIHHMLLHPSLRYLCAQDGTLMLHSSAVVLNGKSLVFTGTGGTGKTTISSLILRHGGNECKLHADDYVFLSTGASSFSYMTRSHLYRGQIRWLPAIQKSLTLRERLHLEIFGRLRELSKDHIKWPLRADPSRLWPTHRIAPKADLGAIIVLNRDNVDRAILARIEPTEVVLQDLIKMNFYEARHFIQLVQKAYGEVYIKDWLEVWKEKERFLLERILDVTPLYRLDIPSSEKDGDRFGEALMAMLNPIVEAGQIENIDA